MQETGPDRLFEPLMPFDTIFTSAPVTLTERGDLSWLIKGNAWSPNAIWQAYLISSALFQIGSMIEIRDSDSGR